MVPLSQADQNLPKIIEKNPLDIHLSDYFFNAQKSFFFSILKPLLVVSLSQADQKLPKAIETPQLK